MTLHAPTICPGNPALAAGLSPGRRRAWTGFTLIEVLLAVTIFSIVLVAINTVFYAAVQLRNKTAESIEQAIPLQYALSTMHRDLANIVLPGTNFFGELQTSQLNSTATNLLSSLSPVNDALPGQSSPAFFTASGLINDDVPWADIQRVSYYLAPPTNNTPGKDLVRSVTRNMLPLFAQPPENEVLMSGLQSITFSFYDGLQWREYWDSTVETNKLPQGIKVELQLVAAEGSRFRPAPIDLVVPVVLQVVAGETNSTTETGGGEL